MTVPMHYSPDLCQATVFVRDIVRRTGKGKYGFSMHYTEQQCSRKRPLLFHFCWQHRHLEGKNNV